MATSTYVQRGLHLFGGLLSIAGLIFIVLRIQTYAEQLDFSRLNMPVWIVIALLSILYGISNLLLARAWWCLLAFLGVAVRWAPVVKIYGISQVAKYVPGNIFHLAGRQTLGMADGLPGREVAKSLFWELSLITFSGALFTLFILPLFWSQFPLWTPAVLFCATALIAFVAACEKISSCFASAFFWQTCFLAMSGLIFTILIMAVAGKDGLPHFSVLCGAYVTAWLAGFVTPGAPAGVGVREMVLLFLLESAIAEADVLLAVLLGRGVTVVGDLCYFFFSAVMKPTHE